MKNVLLSKSNEGGGTPPPTSGSAKADAPIKVKALKHLAVDHNGTTLRKAPGEEFEVSASAFAVLGGLVEKVGCFIVALLLLCSGSALNAQVLGGGLAYQGSAPPSSGDYGYMALGGYDWTGSGSSFTIPASGMTNLLLITNGYSRPAFAILTKYDSFVLELSGRPHTQPSAAGNLNLRWLYSPDGTNWPTIAVGGTNSSTGWFIALDPSATNSNNRFTWSTNITIGAMGYYALIPTNTTDAVLTNMDIRIYVKPKRNG